MLSLSICIISLAPFTSAAVHSLKYFYTATSGISAFPEFIGVGKVDDLEISYYDSTIKQAVPKQDWMNRTTYGFDEGYWSTEKEVAMGYEQTFKADMSILKDRFNQTEGLHAFQKTYGCRWDDAGGIITGFEQFGYDGEDFMWLDLNNMRWIAVVQQAIPTTQRWNRMEMAFPYRRHYFHGECVEWLKKYLDYGKSILQRTVRPEVTLHQKGSGVACHATGFYPEEVKVTWKKDGVEMDDDVDVGRTLPNGDGTFQKRAVLTVSPEERKNAQYSCEVTHRSGDPIVLDHEEEIISSNIGVVVGVVAPILVLILISGVMFKRKIGKLTYSTGQKCGLTFSFN
ncbi:major histocompatibility complex class I-related gene protein-like [Engraulis encrasicolus]|uniref:major histocompatibility complex class I-related gene protein-like n=1 Tax=Engraulis encrasicolus TaxID=184585 RepID=UPI002FCE80E7